MNVFFESAVVDSPVIGRPSTWAGIGRPSKFRIVGVASISRALSERPGASPAPARATMPSGRWVPGRFGSVMTQEPLPVSRVRTQ